MISYDLIPDDVYATLPTDSGEKFVAIVGIAERNFAAQVARLSGKSESGLRRQYVDQLTTAAKELGVGALPAIAGSPSDLEMVSFQAAISAAKVRIRLRPQQGVGTDGLVLGRISRAHISVEIDRLRKYVEASDLPKDKMTMAIKRLDDLQEDLHRNGINLMKLATIVATIAGISGGTVTTLVNGPEAVVNILRWVGEEQQAAEAEQLLLAAPLKALPAPQERPE